MDEYSNKLATNTNHVCDVNMLDTGAPKSDNFQQGGKKCDYGRKQWQQANYDSFCTVPKYSDVEFYFHSLVEQAMNIMGPACSVGNSWLEY